MRTEGSIVIEAVIVLTVVLPLFYLLFMRAMHCQLQLEGAAIVEDAVQNLAARSVTEEQNMSATLPSAAEQLVHRLQAVVSCAHDFCVDVTVCYHDGSRRPIDPRDFKAQQIKETSDECRSVLTAFQSMRCVRISGGTTSVLAIDSSLLQILASIGFYDPERCRRSPFESSALIIARITDVLPGLGNSADLAERMIARWRRW